MLRLYRDPQGEMIFSTSASEETPGNSIPLATEVEAVAPLRRRITDLEEELNVVVCV